MAAWAPLLYSCEKLSRRITTFCGVKQPGVKIHRTLHIGQLVGFITQILLASMAPDRYMTIDWGMTGDSIYRQLKEARIL